MTELLLVIGILLLGYGCRSFDHILIRKLGMIAFMAASFLAVYFLTGSLLGGVAGVLFWFCLPWIELLTRVRAMRMPLDRPFRRRTPPREDFPFLDQATQEIEDVSEFRHVDDWGFQWEESQHFYRFFYDESTKTEAAICMVDDGVVRHAFIKLVSRSTTGRVYVTWNYPFSSPLKVDPSVRLNWDRGSESFEGLVASHLYFLSKYDLQEDDLIALEPDEMLEQMKEDQRRQVDHNLETGVLLPSGEGTCRYSWRGLLYLWTQLVKDMVRLY